MDLSWYLPLMQLSQLTQLSGTELDFRTKVLLAVVLGLLLAAWGIGWALKRQPESTASPAVVRTFNLRVRSWLLMFGVLIFSFLLGYGVTVTLFGLISFWALREFITMTPTRRGDHRTLFWTFVVFTPLQYVLVGVGEYCYQIYTVLIPVYATLIIPARIALSGDPKRFLERVAKIQAGLLICVYSLSHAPALLSLDLKEFQRPVAKGTVSNTENGGTAVSVAETNEIPMDGSIVEPPVEKPAATTNNGILKPAVAARDYSNAGLLFYFILIVQVNDVLQYGWGKLLGKQVIAPNINASRTWEGLIGGVLSTMLIGASLWFVTPFTPWEGACLAGIAASMGSAGGLVMSAIKRDRGVTDYGTLVQGHAGVLDRIDSLCFAAPIFFHLTRFVLYMHAAAG